MLERLNNYMNEQGLRPIDLARILNINKSMMSRIMNGVQPPNVAFLEALSNYSGKSINWWLHGVDEYRSLESLNTLIDTFIEKGFIKTGEKTESVYMDMLHTMLDKEIEVKLEKAKKKKSIK